jgi:predicted aspartyl protease
MFTRILLTLIILCTGIGDSPGKTGESRTISLPGSDLNCSMIMPSLSPLPSDLPIAVSDEVVIPLRKAGRLLLIEARVDDETGNFVFDTGASKLVLNSTYFRKYQGADAGERGGITGEVGTVKQSRVGRIQMGGITYNNVMADMTDLGHIENRRGVKILGLFGFCMLRNMEVLIDVNKNELHLFRLDKSGRRINKKYQEFRADIVQKVEIYQDVLFISPRIGGKILNFCLDTGAESNVISPMVPKKVMSTVTITRRSGLVGSGRPASEALFGLMNDFDLGGKQIPEMQTVITNLENMSAAYGMSIDGMLGYDFFEKGLVSINPITREMKICLRKLSKN